MQDQMDTTQGEQATVFSERRGAERHRVLKGATLSFNNGYGAFECVVKNLSETGARLAFGETSAVPSQFSLQFSGEKQRRQAVVRWRTMNALGVSMEWFLGPLATRIGRQARESKCQWGRASVPVILMPTRSCLRQRNSAW